MEKKMLVVPKYKTLSNGTVIKSGYKAYTVITDSNGKIIRTILKKEK